jgi:uncharacterized protein YjbI with pentapeptide repeats
MIVNGYAIEPGADLSNANLPGANLHNVNLSYADLTGAILRHTDLYGVDLAGATLNWQSHDLIAEILRRNTGGNPHRLMLAGWISMARNKCWDYWLEVEHYEKQWALNVLSQWEGMPR